MTKTEKMNKLYAKVEQKLKQCQRRCNTRIMDLEDIKNLVQDAQEKISLILSTPIDKKYIKNVTIWKQYAVSNNYKYCAETTVARVTVTKYGKISIDVYRTRANKIPYGGTQYNVKAIYV